MIRTDYPFIVHCVDHGGEVHFDTFRYQNEAKSFAEGLALEGITAHLFEVRQSVQAVEPARKERPDCPMTLRLAYSPIVMNMPCDNFLQGDPQPSSRA